MQPFLVGHGSAMNGSRDFLREGRRVDVFVLERTSLFVG